MTRAALARRIAAIEDPIERAIAANLAHQLYGSAPTMRARLEPMVEYQQDPVRFFVEQLGVPEETLRWSMLPEYQGHTWDGTVDPLARILEELAQGNDVGVESGTGTGKTFLGAGVVMWWQASWENAIGITVAPKQDQLLLHIWKEIARLWPRFKRLPVAKIATLQSGKLRIRGGIDESWTATAFVAGVEADSDIASRAKGFHAEHMLYVLEETPGIPRPIMNSIENTCTGDHNPRLALGNPDHQQDELHRFCTSPGVVAIRISAHDHPNVVTGRGVVPGAVSRKNIERRLAKYRTPDARLYLSQVRGISPAESTDALVRWAWLRRAAEHDGDVAFQEGGRPAIGVDVANSENGDRGAIARGKGRALLELRAFPCPNGSKLGVEVAMLAALHQVSNECIGVDAGGVGATTVNKLREIGRWPRALLMQEKPWPTVDVEREVETGASIVPEEHFLNLRAQIAWQFRTDLEHDRLALPYDEELFEELTAIKWETRNGIIRCTPKEEIIDELGRSPDKAEAVLYWNFVRHRWPEKPKPEERSAWDPEALQAEIEQNRRARPPAVARTVDPMVMVSVE